MTVALPPAVKARMCHHKTRYRTEEAANQGKRAIEERRRRHKKPLTLRVYACPVCEGWHLTSTEARQ